jgi:hypothetical protein
MNVRYRVTLTQYERNELGALLSGGKHPARKLKRAQILLAADQGVSDDEIATSVGVGGSRVYRTKRRFVEGNLERALNEDLRPGAERKLTGKEEALLVATACSSPPTGRGPPDAKAAGGRDGQADRARRSVVRDAAAPLDHTLPDRVGRHRRRSSSFQRDSDQRGDLHLISEAQISRSKINGGLNLASRFPPKKGSLGLRGTRLGHFASKLFVKSGT